jgi:hypothetical protein
MPNRLVDENSPYLLQHKDNPVDWFPWGQEALQKARDEDKPIFLSIGYAACHWCHVMEHESFEDPDTASLMNEHFVNIKVDREERPDLDNIYMKAVVNLTGQGGWPMSVFLTPQGEPFYGGTYFPPKRWNQMPSFRDVLSGIVNVWQDDRERALTAGEQLKERLAAEFAQMPLQPGLEAGIAQKISVALGQHYDWAKGGWGQAPKFPQPMVIDFLLRRATRGDSMALDMATHALDAMAKGGMYDVVGGGFARYSVDDDWLVPHFEKMLYDNAQLGLAYLHAHIITKNPSYRRIAEETLAFMQRELTDPDGGFYSSLDADSEGEEGKFYVWSLEEIQHVLNPEQAELLIAAYDIKEGGNFEGHNVLQQVLTDEELAVSIASTPTPEAVRAALVQAHDQLLTARAARIRPGTDDKVLVSWNGLALLFVAESAWYLSSQEYTDLAIRNARFLTDKMMTEAGRLFRSWRAGNARHMAFLEDYAAYGLGLLALYAVDPDPEWFLTARSLADTLIEQFSDPQAGFFDTAQDHEHLIVRPKDQQDNAFPSGNALAAHLLLKMTALTGDRRYRNIAETSILALQPLLVRYPTGFGQWLSALDMLEGPLQELAIISPAPGADEDILDAVKSTYRPRLVIARALDRIADERGPELLRERPLMDGHPTAYLCEGFTCRLPVKTGAELAQELAN